MAAGEKMKISGGKIKGKRNTEENYIKKMGKRP